jgi:hypothetical protein
MMVNNGGPNSKASSNKMDYSDYNGVIKNTTLMIVMLEN